MESQKSKIKIKLYEKLTIARNKATMQEASHNYEKQRHNCKKKSFKVTKLKLQGPTSQLQKAKLQLREKSHNWDIFRVRLHNNDVLKMETFLQMTMVSKQFPDSPK